MLSEYVRMKIIEDVEKSGPWFMYLYVEGKKVLLRNPTERYGLGLRSKQIAR